MQGGVLGNVHGKARFAHGGTAGHDDQVALLETVCHAVEFGKAARHARDLSVALCKLANEVVGLRYDLVDGNQRPLRLAHGDIVDAPLGCVERILQLFFVVHAVADDLAARADELALHALGFNQFNVVLHVRRGRHKRDQIGQVRNPACLIQTVMPLQLGGERNKIHRVAGRTDIPHGGVDDGVGGYVKIFLAQLLEADFEGVCVDEHAAEHRALRVPRVRHGGLLAGLVCGFELFHGSLPASSKAASEWSAPRSICPRGVLPRRAEREFD
ncbi:hypothetical protein SDC9_139412 [bioreactor metagenome]|uniref:Uncharacterized protein n=1 Tax=bioreactor metagenome TaxID=1076179 RepID=A0A645DSG9_9ZZZZ